MKHRSKVEDQEQPSNSSNEELGKAKKEAAFLRQLLKELVSALSKGAVTIPTAGEIVSSVASASE